MILIGLGANLPSSFGQPLQTLCAAIEAIRERVAIANESSFYRTTAWPNPADPPFVNAVVQVETELSPSALLGFLHDIEKRFGRERLVKNAPRTLDLDVLDYDGRMERGPPELPHPRLMERAFVLLPLHDVAPLWRHPVTGKTVDELIGMLPKQDRESVAVLL